MTGALEIAPAEIVVGVPADDPVFAGHYPGYPVLPGVYLIGYADRAARAAAGPGLPRLSSVDSIRFRRPVYPGDRVTVTARLRPDAGGGLICTAVATAGGQTVATLTLGYPPAEGDAR
ncbi:3-hydroxyacyl-ACP dehydratase FabZ family protein [Catenuloplanes indicus]|uniref:3-hydroxyacyl-[acyl-carrier-protein] dehydratase n=1 Tax=Catenuloplanes indicus TaxID=137267 RepID=A0AAE3VU69_9ACTN|nr:3-hydroxyacyl-ACP dehydratase FabZ family protein [Catenuloplanes indicus]MDQ0363891.1 3-hydroxyacyl-[acyl-carrier-protein] dehydratase [Catenuloplanes indicus]